MIAYVFWHAKRYGITDNEYERALVAFHKELASTQIGGFLGSCTTRISGAPWMGERKAQYEDWYLLTDSGALDSLNEKAVADSMRKVHDAVAHMATEGKGGLFRLLTETVNYDSKHALWVSKPRSETYDSFYRDILKRVKPLKTALWRRQLAMGPSPEFCVLVDHFQRTP
jgi:hypothetical protein